MGTSITSIPQTAETGDPAATSHPSDWGEAFRLLSPLVIEMARKAGFTGDDQHEVVQKVGLLLAEKLDELDPNKGTLHAWGAGIARNIVLQMKRSLGIERRRREPNVSVKDLPATSLTPEQTHRAREALWILHAAVREEDRAVFELNAIGGTAAEIGEQLGMPPAMVEWRLKEARKRLARGLARLREDRTEATRVRGVLWPLAVVTDAAASAGGRSPDAAAAAGATGRLRAALLVLVPALLSVHLVGLPGGSGSADDAALTASVATAAVATAVAPPAVTIGVSPAVPSAVAVPDRAAAPPATAHTPPSARPFGGRRWMEYRVLVGAWRKRNATPGPAMERP